MFYDTRSGDHGLPHNPFKACVVPRPIGWVTTLNESGAVNLAPYSFFNGIASEPPMVMFANNAPSDRPSKDSLANCEATGEFVTQWMADTERPMRGLAADRNGIVYIGSGFQGA